MAIGTGSSSLDSFLSEPFLPRVGRTLVNMFTPRAGTPPPTPAGVGAIPQNVPSSSFNPISSLARLNPFSGMPLISGAALGRTRQPEPATPTIPTLPSGTPMVGFDAYPTIPQMPQTAPEPQFVGRNPRPATADDLDAFYGRGAYAPQQPVVAETAPQRLGVQTPYGMVYPTRGQEAAAQKLAQRRPMEARLENIRQQETVRPTMVKSALGRIEEGFGPASLQGLTQAEKIQAMRARGRELAKEATRSREEFFAEGREKSRKAFEESERRRVVAEASRRPSRSAMRRAAAMRGMQTTQRGWDNYIPPSLAQNLAAYDQDRIPNINEA